MEHEHGQHGGEGDRRRDMRTRRGRGAACAGRRRTREASPSWRGRRHTAMLPSACEREGRRQGIRRGVRPRPGAGGGAVGERRRRAPSSPGVTRSSWQPSAGGGAGQRFRCTCSGSGRGSDHRTVDLALAISSASESLTVTWTRGGRPSLIGSAHRTGSRRPTALPLTCSSFPSCRRSCGRLRWSGLQTWNAGSSHHVDEAWCREDVAVTAPDRADVSSAVTVCWNLRWALDGPGREPDVRRFVFDRWCRSRSVSVREPESLLGIWGRDHPPVGHQRVARVTASSTGDPSCAATVSSSG